MDNIFYMFSGSMAALHTGDSMLYMILYWAVFCNLEV